MVVGAAARLIEYKTVGAAGRSLSLWFLKISLNNDR
jgi:hypothetical protein